MVQLLSHSDSLWLHGLQHSRLPCPSVSPTVCSNSCLLSWWCCLTTSFSAVLFSFCFCLQSFPAAGSFPNELSPCIRWPKYWSFIFSISPSNEVLISFRIDWFDLLAVSSTEFRSVTGGSDQNHPEEEEMQECKDNKKRLSEEALQIAEEWREVKGQGERERY